MLGVPLQFDFLVYKHGPFSFDLRDELTAMRADAFLAIRVRGDFYGRSITLGSNHEVLSRRFAAQVAEINGNLEELFQTCREMAAAGEEGGEALVSWIGELSNSNSS